MLLIFAESSSEVQERLSLQRTSICPSVLCVTPSISRKEGTQRLSPRAFLLRLTKFLFELEMVLKNVSVMVKRVLLRPGPAGLGPEEVLSGWTVWRQERPPSCSNTRLKSIKVLKRV